MGLGMLGAIAGLGQGLTTAGKSIMERDREEERDNRMAQRQQELEAKRQAWQEKELTRRIEAEGEQKGLDRELTRERQQQEKEQQDRAYVLNLARHQLDIEKLASDTEYRNNTLDNEGRRIDILGRQADLAERNSTLTDLQKEQLRGIREQMAGISKAMLSETATPESIANGRKELNRLQVELFAVTGIKPRAGFDPREDAEPAKGADEPAPRRPRAGSSNPDRPPAERRPDTSRPMGISESLGQERPSPAGDAPNEPQITNRGMLIELERAGTTAMEALALKSTDPDKAMELAQKVRNSPVYGHLNQLIRKQIAELAGNRK